MNFIDIKLQLLHLTFCLRSKARSLIVFDNSLRFIGLGVAPSLILAAVKFNEPIIFNISLTLSGLLSLTNWIWSICSLVFKLDQHIELCKTYPVKIDSFLAEAEAVIATDKKQMSSYTSKANTLLIEIKTKVESTNLQVSEWLNIESQQKVLAQTGMTCGSCKKGWESPSLYTKKEIKKIIKNKKEFGKKRCIKCGQTIL